MSLRATLLKKVMGYQIQQAMKSDDPLTRRANLEKSARYIKSAQDVVSQPVSAAGVPADWIATPGIRDDCVFLHLHGGAYYTGSINICRDLVSRVGRAAGMRGLALAYRLAPEHPYPAAVEDASSAYRWLLAGGFDPEKIILSGDSSGGGLALAALVNLRDAGDPLPAGGVCLSPWTDLALTGDSIKSKRRADPINKLSYMKFSSRLYAGEHELKTPLISPLYADLRGLPPLFIQTGSEETLLNDSTRFVEKARAAGVEVTVEIWPGMFHIFQLSARFLPEARQAIAGIGRFMGRRVQRPS